MLEPFAPTVPGYCIYFPKRAQRSAPLRLFVDTAKELLLRGGKRELGTFVGIDRPEGRRENVPLFPSRRPPKIRDAVADFRSWLPYSASSLA